MKDDALPGCRSRAGICPTIARTELARLQGAFTALSLANNHSDDYGSVAATASVLRELGLRRFRKRTARWSDFGFRGVSASAALERCRKL